MPTPGAESPIHLVPSGLFGPGGIGFWPAAHGEDGGYHHGFFHLTTIVKRPSGVGAEGRGPSRSQPRKDPWFVRDDTVGSRSDQPRREPWVVDGPDVDRS